VDFNKIGALADDFGAWLEAERLVEEFGASTERFEKMIAEASNRYQGLSAGMSLGERLGLNWAILDRMRARVEPAMAEDAEGEAGHRDRRGFEVGLALMAAIPLSGYGGAGAICIGAGDFAKRAGFFLDWSRRGSARRGQGWSAFPTLLEKWGMLPKDYMDVARVSSGDDLAAEEALGRLCDLCAKSVLDDFGDTLANRREIAKLSEARGLGSAADEAARMFGSMCVEKDLAVARKAAKRGNWEVALGSLESVDPAALEAFAQEQARAMASAGGRACQSFEKIIRRSEGFEKAGGARWERELAHKIENSMRENGNGGKRFLLAAHETDWEVSRTSRRVSVGEVWPDAPLSAAASDRALGWLADPAGCLEAARGAMSEFGSLAEAAALAWVAYIAGKTESALSVGAERGGALESGLARARAVLEAAHLRHGTKSEKPSVGSPKARSL
jgi:hypothetical protein